MHRRIREDLRLESLRRSGEKNLSFQVNKTLTEPASHGVVGKASRQGLLCCSSVYSPSTQETEIEALGRKGQLVEEGMQDLLTMAFCITVCSHQIHLGFPIALQMPLLLPRTQTPNTVRCSG